MSAYCVAAFETTHDAITARTALEGRFSICVMPTPRFITASCGIAVRFFQADGEGVKAVLHAVFPKGGYQIVPLPEK